MDTQQIQEAAAAYRNALLQRLVEHYLRRDRVPSKDQQPITITLFHRLCHHVLAEGYGQGVDLIDPPLESLSRCL